MHMSKDMKMIQNYIYFYHVEKFCVIPEYPDSISDSMSSTFAQTNALSRSAPVFFHILIPDQDKLQLV